MMLAITRKIMDVALSISTLFQMIFGFILAGLRSVPDELCERGLANSFYQLIVAKCFYFEYEGTLGYITIIFY
jgi:hypothetical protein